jgi:hypothetical protein
MLDNQSWKDASAQLIADPKVQNALSVYLVNELYDNVNVASGLEQRLPTNLKPLAAPVAAALRQPATDGVKRLLEGPRVQQLWINASGAAHEKLVNVLENKTGHGISTGNGVVTLDLTELVKEIGTDLGVPASALAKIPPDAGVITVMRSDHSAGRAPLDRPSPTPRQLPLPHRTSTAAATRMAGVLRPAPDHQATRKPAPTPPPSG